MTHRRPRGGTLAEIAVYSFLVCLLGGAALKLLIDYRILSRDFDAKASITRSANEAFAKLRYRLMGTSTTGLGVADDGQSVSIQPIRAVNSLGQTTWDTQLSVLYFDADKMALREGDVGLDSLGVVTGLTGPSVLNQDQLGQAVDLLRDGGKAEPIVRDLVELKFTRTPSDGLAVKAVFEKVTFRGKKMRVEREHQFALMSSGDL